jgi:hypothetical protein
MPSKSHNCRDWNIRIRTVRNPARLRLLNEVREVCRAQRERMTDFMLRALAREVLRCQAEPGKWSSGGSNCW